MDIASPLSISAWVPIRLAIRGEGLLAGVLGECKALVHLDLEYNDIDDEGAVRLVGVLGERKALAHLNLEGNKIGAEGKARLRIAQRGFQQLQVVL